MTVYAVQNTLRRDPETGLMNMKFDLSPAQEYGRIVELLSPSARPTGESIIADLREQLQYFTEGDYLLCIGNPILIGMATAIASQYSPRVKMLQWSGFTREYIVIEVNLALSFDGN